jgi:hypothetical protein
MVVSFRDEGVSALLALSRPVTLLDLYSSPLEGEDKVVGHIRLHDGALYESWGGSANWSRLPRVYNTWRVWLAELLTR